MFSAPRADLRREEGSDECFQFGDFFFCMEKNCVKKGQNKRKKKQVDKNTSDNEQND